MNDRQRALVGAITIGGSDRDVLRRAELFHRFLKGTAPYRLSLTVGSAREQASTDTTGTETGAHMAQLHDTQQLDVTVDAKDAKGFDVVDTFTATVDDESVATVVAAEDGRTFTVVAGNPGSAVLTVTDGTLSATLAVDVVPGDVALISLSAGDPTEQPAA